MELHILRKASALTLVVILSLSCGALEKVIPQAGGTPGAVSSSSDSGSSEGMAEPTDPRVEATLALRSVQMELQSVFPGEDANRILISVDAAGNQRIETTLPVVNDSLVTPESPEWNVFEIFVVDGKAYARTGKTGSAEADPQENKALGENLYAPTGPGMWLILLPEENFTSAGKELKGGFEAVKYTVEGSLDAGEIRGEFWVDEQTGALMGANLSLAESIFHPMEDSGGGRVTIDFKVEKADISPISVP